MLYLEEIFGKKVGTITLTLPDGSTLVGLSTDDGLKISLKNNWASLLPDVGGLGELYQLLGSHTIASWVSSSKLGWKGTDPIKVTAEFYLFSWKPSVNIKNQIKPLIKLATIDKSHDNSAIDNGFTVTVHGGYSTTYAEDNTTIFSSNTSDTQPGLVSLRVGDQGMVKGLLLESIETTNSSVQVAKGIPLFIKVNAQFTGHRAAISNDIDTIYG